MASLQDTIRTGSGQLEKVSGVDTALDAGLQAAPITPLGAAGLPNPNPDVSKMAGTGAQKANSLRMSIQGQNDLGTQQRQAGQRTQASDDETKQLSLSEQLSKTGGLEARVPTMVANMVAQAQANGTQNPDNVNFTTDAATNTAISSIIKNPTDYASAQLVASKLGIPAPTDIPSMTAFQTALEGKIPGFSEAAAAAGLQGSQSALQLSQADWQSLGFQDENQAAQLLNVPVEQLQGMNITQVADAIQTEIYKDFQETAQWQQRANDPTLGATERAEARSHLRDLGAVGVTSATAGMDKLADDLQGAKQVPINGQMVQVKDLLDSQYVSGLAKTYLEGSADFKAEFAKNEPGLAKFFDTYQDVLGQAVKNVDAGMQNYANLQMANAGLAKSSNGDVLPDEIMSQVFPGWGSQQTTNFDPKTLRNGGAVFDALQGKTGLTKTQISDLYNNISAVGPQFAQELMSNFTADDLQKYGLLDKASPQFANLQNNISLAKQIQSIDPATATDDQLSRLAGANSSSDISSLADQVTQMTRSGLFGTPPGDISSLQGGALRQAAAQLKNNPPTTLRALGNYQNTLADTYNKLKSYVQQTQSPEYKALAPYLNAGAIINSTAATDISQNVSTAVLGNIITKSNFSNMFTPDAQKQMVTDYQNRYVAENLLPIAKLSGFDNTQGAAPGLALRTSRIADMSKQASGLGTQLAALQSTRDSGASISSIKDYQSKLSDFKAQSADNLRDLSDLYDDTSRYVTNLQVFRDANPNAQVGPMAAKYSSMISDAKAQLAQMDQMRNYYNTVLSPNWQPSTGGGGMGLAQGTGDWSDSTASSGQGNTLSGALNAGNGNLATQSAPAGQHVMTTGNDPTLQALINSKSPGQLQIPGVTK